MQTFKATIKEPVYRTGMGLEQKTTILRFQHHNQTSATEFIEDLIEDEYDTWEDTKFTVELASKPLKYPMKKKPPIAVRPVPTSNPATALEEG